MKHSQSHATRMRAGISKEQRTGRPKMLRCCATVLKHGLKKGLGCGKAGSKDPALPAELVKGAGKREYGMCFDFHCVKEVVC